MPLLIKQLDKPTLPKVPAKPVEGFINTPRRALIWFGLAMVLLSLIPTGGM